jgi:DNA polymerase III psi subunit
MTSRRDWQLQQLGITQWALRRPTALQGEIAISIPAHVRLVMVAEELPALNEPLIGDVLRSLKLTSDQVLQLTPERVAMLLLTVAAIAGEWGARREHPPGEPDQLARAGRTESQPKRAPRAMATNLRI